MNEFALFLKMQIICMPINQFVVGQKAAVKCKKNGGKEINYTRSSTGRNKYISHEIMVRNYQLHRYN